jgi:hypothetical protein
MTVSIAVIITARSSGRGGRYDCGDDACVVTGGVI